MSQLQPAGSILERPDVAKHSIRTDTDTARRYGPLHTYPKMNKKKHFDCPTNYYPECCGVDNEAQKTYWFLQIKTTRIISENPFVMY
ncbi:hypothetical protein KEM48_011194 [Puccinia striiformis f. sp. tritici PST-130]|nr:hypothetical protein KEM48_011194 [Puccinia striiformis f. sp. tritici PST-130]